MTWYTAFYGSWKDLHGVIRVGETYNKREIFEIARSTASATGKTVTISAETPKAGRGLWVDIYEVTPDGKVVED